MRRNWTAEFQRKTYTVPNLEFHECVDCGEKVYGPQAMRRIEAASPAFRQEAARKAIRLMALAQTALRRALPLDRQSEPQAVEQSAQALDTGGSLLREDPVKALAVELRAHCCFAHAA